MNKDELVIKVNNLKADYKQRRENMTFFRREMDDCDRCRADHILEAKLDVIDDVLAILNTKEWLEKCNWKQLQYINAKENNCKI